MKKTSLYRYLGKNGLITSEIELPNVDYIPMYDLAAEDGCVLTDGTKVVSYVRIFAEDLNQWTEIISPLVPPVEDN